MTPAIRASAILLSVLLVNCGDGYYNGPGTGTSGNIHVTSVTVTPPSPSMHVGDVLQMSAVLLASNGDTVKGRSVTWQTTNGAIVDVNATSGLATAIAPGAALLVATVSGDTTTGAAAVLVTTTLQSIR